MIDEMLATTSQLSAIEDLVKSSVLFWKQAPSGRAIIVLHQRLFLQSGPIRERKRSRKDQSHRYKDTKSIKDQDRKAEENETVERLRPVDLLRSCSVIHVWVRSSRASLTGSKTDQRPGHMQIKDLPFPPSRGESRE